MKSKTMVATTSKSSSKFPRWVISLLLTSFFLLGCAPKIVDLSTINPKITLQSPLETSVYDSENDRIVFYNFSLKDGVLLEKSWAKTLPFRVEFMDLWVSGLGHDLRRLTDNHAETIKDALMYGAQKEGMKTLHVNQKDYIIDIQFARKMVDAIKAYEEKMERYNKEREFPFLLLPRH